MTVMLDLSQVPAKPLPNRYTVYDANIEGPRARYGNFSYAVIGRKITEPVGLQTYAGCMTIDNFDPKHPLPLNAAASGIFAGPKLKLENHFSSVNNLAINGNNTVLLGHDCAGLTTSYDLAGQTIAPRTGPPGTIPSSWKGNQQWVLLPDRIIGLITTLPGKEKACEVTGRVKLVYGGVGIMYPKEIKTINETNYSFGTLKVKIHSHNYGKVDIEENTPTLREGRNVATDIRLRDTDSLQQGNSALRDYTEPLSFVVEISEITAPDTTKIEKIETADLRGLKVHSGGRQFVTLMNTSTSPKEIQTAEYAGASGLVLQSFKYKESNSPAKIPSVTLAPNQGVMFISGEKADAVAPWSSFSAMMEAFSKGESDITPFPLPRIQYP